MTEAIEHLEKATFPPKPYKLMTLADVFAMPNPTWTIDGVIPGSGVSVIFGQPNAGKTFIALDMALHVAYGVDWFGRRTEQRPVVYVGLEGIGSIGTRMKGLCLERFSDLVAKKPELEWAGTTDMPIRFLLGEEFRFAVDDDSNTANLIDSVRNLKLEKPMIIIDTLALALAGSEVDNEVMAAAARQANHLSAQTGGNTVLIHHPNKANEEDMRGGSALRGAVDAAVLVSGDKFKGRAWRMTKNRDGSIEPCGAFDLVPVEIPSLVEGEEGPVTCVVKERTDRNSEAITRREPTGANQKKLLGIVREKFPTGCTEPQLVEAWRGTLPPGEARRARPQVVAALGNPSSTANRHFSGIWRVGTLRINNLGVLF